MQLVRNKNGRLSKLMTEVATRRDIPLNWDVLVTPGIPMVTSDLPPGAQQGMWRPISSTLIYGKRDAVLVDALITIEQADALVDWVEASGKNLTTIYVTHGHGDHFFGIGALLDRFPNARAVATPDVVKLMRQQASPDVLTSFWNPLFPGQIPDCLVIADELKPNVIDLEGQDLVVVEAGHTDTDYTTCLHVSSVGLVVAGDAAYNARTLRQDAGALSGSDQSRGSALAFGARGQTVIYPRRKTMRRSMSHHYSGLDWEVGRHGRARLFKGEASRP